MALTVDGRYQAPLAFRQEMALLVAAWEVETEPVPPLEPVEAPLLVA